MVDFYDDINKLSENINNTVGSNIKLNLQLYNNIDTVDTMLKWKSCFDLLGQTNLFTSKNVQKIIYCLLSDCSIINTVNDEPSTLTFYDGILTTFWSFDIIDKQNRNIKIKLFNVCNKMVIIDYCKYPIYKVYYLYNLTSIKDFYGIKVNFDSLIKDLYIEPSFIGNIYELKKDYKKLSIQNVNICNKYNLTYIQSYFKHTKKIGKQILKTQLELFDMYQ